MDSIGTNVTLEDLDSEEADRHVGGVVIVSLIMVVGIIGNSHVLFIYSCKITTSTNYRIFFMFLAGVDFVTCCLGMPVIIVELRHPLMFPMVSACKLVRFIIYVTCSSSAILLAVIAVDRYKKICTPLKKQLNTKTAKIASVAAVLAAVAMSWPTLLLYGQENEDTRIDNITGIVCTMQKSYSHLNFPAYFNIFLSTLAFVESIFMTALYIRVYLAVRKHTSFVFVTTKGPVHKCLSESSDTSVRQRVPPGKDSSDIGTFAASHQNIPKLAHHNLQKQPKGNTASSENMSDSSKETVATVSGSELNSSFEKDRNANYTVFTTSVISENENTSATGSVSGENYQILSNTSSNISKTSSSSSTACVEGIYYNQHTGARLSASDANSRRRAVNRLNRYRRMTFAYFLITTIFFLSLVPYLILSILSLFRIDTVTNMSYTMSVFYNTMIRFVLVNKIVNPIVIFYLDQNYRRHFKLMYVSLLCCFSQHNMIKSTLTR